MSIDKLISCLFHLKYKIVFRIFVPEIRDKLWFVIYRIIILWINILFMFAISHEAECFQWKEFSLRIWCLFSIYFFHIFYENSFLCTREILRKKALQIVLYRSAICWILMNFINSEADWNRLLNIPGDLKCTDWF